MTKTSQSVSNEDDLLTLDHETLKDLESTAYVVGGWWGLVVTSQPPAAPVSGTICNQTNNPGAATSAA